MVIVREDTTRLARRVFLIGARLWVSCSVRKGKSNERGELSTAEGAGWRAEKTSSQEDRYLRSRANETRASA